MLRNYLYVALRNLKKEKIYSFINIFGLAIGLASTILIFLWVKNELSYDDFHKNKNNIVRVVGDWKKFNWNGFEGTPRALALAVKNEIPGIVNAVRIGSFQRLVIKYGDKSIYEDSGIFADPSLFKIFDFGFVKGNPETSLIGPNDIVITETLSGKLFGNIDPIGKTIELDGEVKNVSGLLKDIPENSHLQFSFVQSFESIDKNSNPFMGWAAFNFVTYLQLQNSGDIPVITGKLMDIARKNNCPQVVQGVEFRLQPLSKVYLDAREFDRNFYKLGDSTYVYVFSGAALVVLLIACINFMNLSTARSMKRAKEVGLRKTIGASRIQLMKQFYGESILLAIISVIFAIILIEIFIPAFNNISGKHIKTDFTDIGFVCGILLTIIITGIISGTYPAMFLSSFEPIKVLKSNLGLKVRGITLRKLLVVFQFFLSVSLIVGTIVVYEQLRYMQNMKLGFDKENIVYVPIKENIGSKYDFFRNRLLESQNISAVGAHTYNFAKISYSGAGWDWEGRDPNDKRIFDMTFSGVDFDFFKTLNMVLLEGRLFSKEYPSDTINAVVLNEAAVKKMGIISPLGKRTTYGGQNYIIIGVTKDAYFTSLHQKIRPRLFYLTSMREATREGIVLIKTKGNDIPAALSYIKRIWNQINSFTPFEYNFLDDTYEHLYKKEKQTEIILNCFATLTIIISCLGLFGLASFTIERKSKEIGIRKVLGASITKIVCHLSKEFLIWVTLANIISIPVTYYLMDKWLQDFAYRIDIGAWIFMVSTFITLFIAIVAIGIQVIKGAFTDPVKSLKYE